MKRNFELDQDIDLEVVEDLSVKGGICHAMTTDWLQNEIFQTRKPQQYYREVYRFIPRQRSLLFVNSLNPTYGLLNLNSDPYQGINIKKVPYPFINKIPDCSDVSDELYYIYLTDEKEFHHCIGLSIIGGVYRLFDANHGEFEHNSGNEAMSKLRLQIMFMRLYPYHQSPVLTATRLGRKSL